MKKLFFILFAAITCLVSCKEIGPLIVISVAQDTTYVVAPPAAQPHNALVEEFTGASCSNCPLAHDALDGIISQYTAGRVNAIGLYINNFPQTTPPPGALQDYRTAAATTIGQTIYGGISAMPLAGIDRVTQGTAGLLQGSGTWSSSVTTATAMNDSINLTIQSTYNAGDANAIIVADVTYVQPMSTKQKLSVVIVEDSIVDVQEFPPAPIGPYASGYDSAYVFNNVCRDFVSALPYGDPILDTMATKQPGRVLQAVYRYKLKQNWVAKHCRLVAFVTNADNTVLQSAQVKIAP